ncbi:hypothetical protein ABPG77_002128 [Micractinium sp. CCAP 211/92]
MRPVSAAVLCAVALLCSSRVAAVEYARPTNGDCLQPGGAGTPADAQLYPEQYMLIESARGFSVQYFSTYKVVENHKVNETYVLFQCGAPTPDFTAFPEGAKFFQVPLLSISAPETVPYAFVDFLGLGDRVHDVSPYVTSPCGQALLACPGRTSPDFSTLSNATLLDAAVGGTVDGVVVSEEYPYAKAFTVSAAEDPGALNRAEWIKFVALFFNLEKNASDIYDAIQARYEATKAAAAGASTKPVVAWAQHFKYDKDENYQLSFAPYKAELTEDAGAAMLDRDALKAVTGVQGDPFDPASLTLVYSWGTKGAFATQEEAKTAFLDALKQADVIIDETYSLDPVNYDGAALLKEYGLTAQEAASVPAIAGQKVFREDGLLSYSDAAGYGLDWFEGAIARPDAVLTDVVRAANPSLAQAFTWIRNIYTEKPVVKGADACPVNKPCTAEPATICPFVQLCTDGQAPAILESSANGQCQYAPCGATNAATAAAPALLLTVLVVAMVELLLNIC